MAAVRSKENKAEVVLRRELWRLGFRYRLYRAALPGRPDLVFVSAHAVVFVDGDFWHGRPIREDGERAFRKTMRTERRDWWVAKLKRNIIRDNEVNAALRSMGWLAIRVWESEVKRNPTLVANKVAKKLVLRQKRSWTD